MRVRLFFLLLLSFLPVLFFTAAGQPQVFKHYGQRIQISATESRVCPLALQGDIYGFWDKETQRLYTPSEIGERWRTSRLPVPFENGETGYLAPDGRLAIAPQWTDGSEFDEYGLARVINYDGNPDNLLNFVALPGVAGYIDTTGHYVIPMAYSFIDHFSGGVARFCRGMYDESAGASAQTYPANPYHGYKYGLINVRGEIVLPDDTYDFIWLAEPDPVRGFIFCVQQGSKFGIIDTKGEVVVPLRELQLTQVEDDPWAELWLGLAAIRNTYRAEQ